MCRLVCGFQTSDYLKIDTSSCPAYRKIISTYICMHGKKCLFTLRSIEILLALQPEALVNTSWQVDFLSPGFCCEFLALQRSQVFSQHG